MDKPRPKPKTMTDTQAVDVVYGALVTNQVELKRFRRACKRLNLSDEATRRAEYLAGYRETFTSDVRPEFK